MSCHQDEPVRLAVAAVPIPGRRPDQPDLYRGTASCGWRSRSVGVESRAWGWGRQHAAQSHDGLLVECAAGRHTKNPRDKTCRRCGKDLMTPEQAALAAVRALAKVDF